MKQAGPFRLYLFTKLVYETSGHRSVFILHPSAFIL